MDIDKTAEELAISKGISKEDLLNKIEEKLERFSGVLSREGALYMAAKELGIEIGNSYGTMKIKDIGPSSKKVSIIGRAFKISPIREFVKSNGSKGKVVNISISDGTGYIRFPLWEDQVNLVQEGLIGLGSVIQVSNAMSKENTFGELELVLGKFSSIKNIEENDGIPSYESLAERYSSNSVRRAPIRDAVTGNTEIAGTVVQVFRSNFVFENAPDESYMVLSCVVDDGTASIRSVFFRELAEEAAGVSVEELKNKDPEERYRIISKNLLGKEVIMRGSIRKNVKFDKPEIIASEIKSLNVLEESKKLIDLLESTVGA